MPPFLSYKMAENVKTSRAFRPVNVQVTSGCVCLYCQEFDPIPSTEPWLCCQRGKIYALDSTIIRDGTKTSLHNFRFPANASDNNGLAEHTTGGGLPSCLTDTFLVITMIIGIKPVTNHNECHLCSNRINKRQLAHSPPNFYVYNYLQLRERVWWWQLQSESVCAPFWSETAVSETHTSKTALSNCCYSSAGPSS
jgi:hypothetical protein